MTITTATVILVVAVIWGACVVRAELLDTAGDDHSCIRED